MTKTLMCFSVLLLVGSAICQSSSAEGPLSQTQQKQLEKSLNQLLEDSEKRIQEKPSAVDGYSQRGDANFFLGRFKDAVADYDKTVELDASLDASHWRRGIALFYAGRYEDAAKQFERYHSFDQIDRENGIWRYLSQHQAYGRDKAREGLLKYQKDDREPFPSVYKLFSGALTPDEIFKAIEAVDISKREREQRLFYANLYVGLNYAVEHEDDLARKYLAAATQSTWPMNAGYGPHYMWQVGRLHEELLRNKSDK
jgi:lipoprotein NlpI